MAYIGEDVSDIIGIVSPYQVPKSIVNDGTCGSCAKRKTFECYWFGQRKRTTGIISAACSFYRIIDNE